jgi:hypothetical protein
MCKPLKPTVSPDSTERKRLLALVPIKGDPLQKIHIIGKHYIHIVNRKHKYNRRPLKKNFCFRGLIETAKADFGNLRVEYICEFEPLCETAFARESGP